MNYINITNSSHNTTTLSVYSEDESSNDIWFKLLYVGLPLIIITIAIMIIYYFRRRKNNLEKVDLEKNDASLNYFERSILKNNVRNI